ncbi:hypothetical protein PTNB73_03312 [Pyrenophora teres f. teres]|nr:hypothetical protein HRS9122_04071 [Pyrenophora teres f. teres]KAE8871853.1 hypothetical protein PTNB73_03312 [Pyrenophora teres f. teres]
MISSSSISLPETTFHPRMPTTSNMHRHPIARRQHSAPPAPEPEDGYEYYFDYSFEYDYNEEEDNAPQGRVVSRGFRWFLRHYLWRTDGWKR